MNHWLTEPNPWDAGASKKSWPNVSPNCPIAIAMHRSWTSCNAQVWPRCRQEKERKNAKAPRQSLYITHHRIFEKCRSLFIKDGKRLYTSFSCISSQPSRPNKNLPTSLEVTHVGFENWLRNCAAISEAMSLSAGWLAGTLAPPSSGEAKILGKLRGKLGKLASPWSRKQLIY